MNSPTHHSSGNPRPMSASPDLASVPKERHAGFWFLLVTQFQGAFSDNALKWLAIFLIMGLGLSNQDRDRLIPLVGALFALPFIVFS